MIGALIGKKVIVRTVTHYYTGLLIAVGHVEGNPAAAFLRLDDAAWIADTGRWHKALHDGSLEEVEPYPGTCYVSLGAVVDMCEWDHELPRTAK
jgi:hypothetical protein